MNLNTPTGQLNPEILLQMAMESCMAKSILSAGAGFALGGVFGTFMSSIDWNVNTEEYAKLTTRQQMRAALKDMGTKSLSTAKSFGKVGFLFSGTECIIESVLNGWLMVLVSS
jgi:import inner membrane translocase subunit TIM22